MFKVIIGLIALTIVMGSCIVGLRLTRNEAVAPLPTSTPTHSEKLYRDNRQATAISAYSTQVAQPRGYTPTARTPTPQVRSTTVTSSNEREHQLWLERDKHYSVVQGFVDELNVLIADNRIDEREAKLICDGKSNWNRKLTEVVEYVSEFRKLNPDFVAEPLNGLLELERVARESLEVLANAPC